MYSFNKSVFSCLIFIQIKSRASLQMMVWWPNLPTTCFILYIFKWLGEGGGMKIFCDM